MSSHLNEHGITHLRHVDLAVTDYETQRAFYRDTWGLTEQGTDSGLSYFAAEGSPEQYVVRLRQSDEKRLDLIAFGAQDRAAVDALAAQLGSNGVQLVGEPGELQTAGGGYGFRFFDIDGRTIEISADVETRQHRAIEEGEAIPVRISHAVMNSNDPNKTMAFYSDVLGFKLSDTLWSEHMGEMMHFMRCNDWHHSLAIAKGPHTSVHHVSFEMRGLDEYMRGTGRVMRAGIKKIWGPGPPQRRQQHVLLLPRPERQHHGVHDRAREDRGRRVAPLGLRHRRPDDPGRLGHRGPDVGDHRPRLVQRPRQGRLRRPACLGGRAASASDGGRAASASERRRDPSSRPRNERLELKWDE